MRCEKWVAVGGVPACHLFQMQMQLTREEAGAAQRPPAAPGWAGLRWEPLQSGSLSPQGSLGVRACGCEDRMHLLLGTRQPLSIWVRIRF